MMGSGGAIIRSGCRRRWRQPLEHEWRAAQLAAVEAAHGPARIDRCRAPVERDHRSLKAAKILRSDLSSGADAITRSELFENLSGANRAQQVLAGVNRVSEQRELLVKPTRGDRLEQGSVRPSGAPARRIGCALPSRCATRRMISGTSSHSRDHRLCGRRQPYAAKWRVDGRQRMRRIGPAWLEPDGDGRPRCSTACASARPSRCVGPMSTSLRPPARRLGVSSPLPRGAQGAAGLRTVKLHGLRHGAGSLDRARDRRRLRPALPRPRKARDHRALHARQGAAQGHREAQPRLRSRDLSRADRRSSAVARARAVDRREVTRSTLEYCALGRPRPIAVGSRHRGRAERRTRAGRARSLREMDAKR